jgi:pyrophosphatase PpaX
MLNTVQAILFDVDGTLLDTREFIYQAFEHTFQQHHLPMVSRDNLAARLGQSLESIYECMVPSHNCHLLCDTHRSFQENNLHLSVLFPHVETTLTALQKRGIRLAVVTTRSRRTSVRTLENAGIARFFEVVVSGEDVTNLKPDPEPLRYALTKLGIAPDQAVMVGDTAADVLAGKSAGTRTIAVTYGFGGPMIRQYNPDFVIDDIEMLLQC